MNNNSILPFGSVVSLKNSKRKVMIIGAFQKSLQDGKMYDYCGILHPYGYLNSNDVYLFNTDKISNVYFTGYFDNAAKEHFDDLIWSYNKSKEGV